jgi:uncharacterized protein (DUF58 family)
VSDLRNGLTTRASCLLAAGVTALVCGLLLGVVDLVRAGVLVLTVPIAAALVVFRSQVRIANRRSAEPGRAVAGGTVTVHLTLTNRSLLRTGALMLEDQLPAHLRGRARFVLDDGLASRESRTVSYRMPRLPRGRYRAGPLRIRLTDPFRLVDLMRSFTATNEFVVAPVVEPLPSTELSRSQDIGENAGSHSIGSHGADDASTREYRTGDDLRKIHWRSSARIGSLMVRQEERPWQGQVTLLLDLRENAHTRRPAPNQDVRKCDSMEWAISAAASIGTHLLISGRELGLVSDLSAPTRLGLSDSGQLSDYLATVRAQRHEDLSRVAGLVSTLTRETTVVAVLGEVDAHSLRLLAEAHPRGSRSTAFAILLDTRTWLGADPSGPDEPCHRAARILRGAGWRALVVSRDDSIAHMWQALVQPRGAGVLSTGVRR